MFLVGKRFRQSTPDEPRTAALEWALILGLFVVAAIIAIALVGPKVADMWSSVETPAPVSATH